MEQLSCVLGRRSVRKYTDEPVSKEHEDLLLSAGFSAPSARNARPWEFIVVRDKARLEKLSTVRQHWPMLKNAGLAIVVCANLRGYQGSNKDFFVQDCAAATQNILIAAEGLGLGAVWLGCYPTEEGPEGGRRILEIPGDIIPFSVISVGHPAEHAKPHPQIVAERVHYDRY
ncbi:nitroreductase family protein [Christensenella minuta]|uniref:Nitroreductase family protein n=1 Tax=Christensenella minuta TaxID=626937 RepID=A0A136Q0V4_9FIRM|nr:nitroreductase family protein [Christensenella minuta]KXK64321.1 nitroreductase family protein [Christensenella minuta]